MELVLLVHCDFDLVGRWRLDPNCMPEILQIWARVKISILKNTSQEIDRRMHNKSHRMVCVSDLELVRKAKDMHEPVNWL